MERTPLCQSQRTWFPNIQHVMCALSHHQERMGTPSLRSLEGPPSLTSKGTTAAGHGHETAADLQAWENVAHASVYVTCKRHVDSGYRVRMLTPPIDFLRTQISDLPAVIPHQTHAFPMKCRYTPANRWHVQYAQCTFTTKASAPLHLGPIATLPKQQPQIPAANPLSFPILQVNLCQCRLNTATPCLT